MEINNFFKTNFEINNLLGLNTNQDANLLKNRIIVFNRKFDGIIPQIKYAVDYIGMEMINTFEKSEHYKLLLNNIPKDGIFLFSDLLFFSKTSGFEIKPTIIGFIIKTEINLVDYKLIENRSDHKGDFYLYVKINYYGG
jgi:hypothetical protein